MIMESFSSNGTGIAKLVKITFTGVRILEGKACLGSKTRDTARIRFPTRKHPKRISNRKIMNGTPIVIYDNSYWNGQFKTVTGFQSNRTLVASSEIKHWCKKAEVNFGNTFKKFASKNKVTSPRKHV